VAVNALRSSLAALISEVRGDPAQPQEIARRFGLDKTLTWKISRVICDDDALAGAVHMPGRASVRALVDAMSREGAPEAHVRPVLAAMDRFEEFVEAHCGDRNTFEVMLGGSVGAAHRKRAENARKAFYQGASAIWGVQARVHVSLHFVAPNAGDPERLDLGVMAGLLEFRRLRPDVSWTVATLATYSDKGGLERNWDVRPMDPTLNGGDAPMLAAFCSTPLPRFRRNTARENITRFELTEGSIGIKAAADCITGWVARGAVSRHRTERDQFGEHAIRLSTPVTVLYHDLYVHRSLTFAFKPTVHLYSDLQGGPIYPSDGNESGRLPITEEIVELGEGPPSLGVTDIPRHRAMVETGTASMGRSPAEFRGFRFKMKYPPIPAQALYRYNLPERS